MVVNNSEACCTQVVWKFAEILIGWCDGGVVINIDSKRFYRTAGRGVKASGRNRHLLHSQPRVLALDFNFWIWSSSDADGIYVLFDHSNLLCSHKTLFILALCPAELTISLRPSHEWVSWWQWDFCRFSIQPAKCRKLSISWWEKASREKTRPHYHSQTYQAVGERLLPYNWMIQSQRRPFKYLQKISRILGCLSSRQMKLKKLSMLWQFMDYKAMLTRRRSMIMAFYGSETSCLQISQMLVLWRLDTSLLLHSVNRWPILRIRPSSFLIISAPSGLMPLAVRQSRSFLYRIAWEELWSKKRLFSPMNAIRIWTIKIYYTIPGLLLSWACHIEDLIALGGQALLRTC